MPRIIVVLIFGIFFTHQLCALTFSLPPKGEQVLGDVKEIYSEPGDTFYSIARRYDVGYFELVEANRDIDPNNIAPWTQVKVPTQFILPKAPRVGLVINLAELRLYYFPPGRDVVYTYPVGIGREGWETPVGLTKIIAKTEKPTWVVPEAVLNDVAERGGSLPKVVPPGPENPLGDYAMRLSKSTYLIHGTNNPDGVGMRSSAGCIRMFPEDIKSLFNNVSVGAPVRILDEPFKVGERNNALYLEAHQPLQEDEFDGETNLTPMIKLVVDKLHGKTSVYIDWREVISVAEAQTGIPTQVLTLHHDDLLEDAQASDNTVKLRIEPLNR